jgi:glycosyltransferase involved in cell wall biosynthesis
VCFLGWREDVPDLLDASDLSVLPSLEAEALPYSILEAMGHALPVVATDVAGVPEAIAHGESGYVVPPSDARALAAAIGELLASPERRAAFGAAGRARVEDHHDPDRMTERMLDLYDAARDSRVR